MCVSSTAKFTATSVYVVVCTRDDCNRCRPPVYSHIKKQHRTHAHSSHALSHGNSSQKHRHRKTNKSHTRTCAQGMYSCSSMNHAHTHTPLSGFCRHRQKTYMCVPEQAWDVCVQYMATSPHPYSSVHSIKKKNNITPGKQESITILLVNVDYAQDTVLLCLSYLKLCVRHRIHTLTLKVVFLRERSKREDIIITMR
jgi:hypothetical protein